MRFCECCKYEEVAVDMCRCGHYIDDHITQTIDGCNARMDPAEMGLFP